MKSTVIIADGQTSVRQMLMSHLHSNGAFQVVGEATTGFEALSLCRRTRPELIVLELDLPEMDGIEVVRQLQRESCRSRQLVYSGGRRRERILEALHARPHGFVHKDDSLLTLMEAIQAVTRGSSYFSPFATKIMDGARGEGSPSANLTGRERTVLQMVAEGRSNKEMAERMSVSSKTVEYHRARLMVKLGVHDVATLTRCAIRLGVVAD